MKCLKCNTDKEMNGIRKALYRGEWTGLGIKSWRDLLNYTFGERCY